MPCSLRNLSFDDSVWFGDGAWAFDVTGRVFVFEGVQMFEDATTNLCVVLHDQQFRWQQIVKIWYEVISSRAGNAGPLLT